MTRQRLGPRKDYSEWLVTVTITRYEVVRAANREKAEKIAQLIVPRNHGEAARVTDIEPQEGAMQ